MQFKTERLPLAVFLHAANRLSFKNCEPSRPGKLVFIFDDPDNRGIDEQLAFDAGASVPANAIFGSYNFMRQVMTETKSQFKDFNFDRSSTRL